MKMYTYTGCIRLAVVDSRVKSCDRTAYYNIMYCHVSFVSINCVNVKTTATKCVKP